MRNVSHWVAILAIIVSPIPMMAQTQSGPLRLRILPGDQVLNTSATQQYSASRSFFRGTFLSGGEQDISNIAGWQSSNPSVTISPAGLATAVSGPDAAVISILNGPYRLSAPIAVNATTLSSITVTPGTPSLPVGRQLQFTATGNYSDSSHHDLTFAVQWSSNAGAATVNGVGQAQGISQGPATITATCGGLCGNGSVTNNTTVTVVAPALASRTITPIGAVIDLGSSHHYRIDEAFSDGTFQDATENATWSSQSATVASVSNTSGAKGFTTAVGGGETRVTAGFASGPSPTAIVDVRIPTPRFAYGVNADAKTISIFIVEATTGKLTSIGSQGLPATPGPLTIVPEPGGQFLYVPLADGTILGFLSDPGSGGLSPVPTSPLAANALTQRMVTDAAGHFLYALTSVSLVNGLQAFTIDPLTGALAPSGAAAPTGKKPTSTVIAPNSGFGFVTNHDDDTLSAYTLDPGTGVPTLNGAPVSTGSGPGELTMDPTGHFLFVANQGSNDITVLGLDPFSGLVVNLSTKPVGIKPTAVKVDPHAHHLVVANLGSNDVSALNITPGTGALVLAGTVPAGTSPAGVGIDPQGQFVYVVNSGSGDISTYTLDDNTGNLTAGDTIRAQAGTADIAIATGPPVTFVGDLLYIGNLFSNTISAFSASLSTGNLIPVPGSPFHTGGVNSNGNCTSGNCNTGSGDVEVDPAGRFAYLANRGSNNISGFKVDPASGALTPLPGSPFAVSASPRTVYMLPTGKFLYIGFSNNNCSSSCPPPVVEGFSIDPNDGHLTSIPGSPFSVPNDARSFASDLSGHFLFTDVSNCCPNVSGVAAFTIDGNTGAITPVAGSPFSSGGGGNGSDQALVVDPTSQFLYELSNGIDSTPPNPSLVSHFLINSTTGALVAGAQFAAPNGFGPNAITVDPAGHFAYIGYNSGPTGTSASQLQQYSIDAATGALTSVGSPIATNGYPRATIEPSGKFLYLSLGFEVGGGTDNVRVYSVNQATGTLTFAKGPFNTGGQGSASMTIVRKTQ